MFLRQSSSPAYFVDDAPKLIQCSLLMRLFRFIDDVLEISIVLRGLVREDLGVDPIFVFFGHLTWLFLPKFTI